ncbi:hypothetical protein ACQJBY_060842 [Aegilops geniculata]
MEEGGQSSAAPWPASRTLADVDAWCEAGDAVPTETRWPTDVCSTARNCFHGFLGHPVMFEMEMPPCFTNARLDPLPTQQVYASLFPCLMRKGRLASNPNLNEFSQGHAGGKASRCDACLCGCRSTCDMLSESPCHAMSN